MIQTINIESQEQWLAERAKDITSTEVAALYGLSPYLTEFELFHRKRDQEVVKIEPNERMKWGNRLEAAIAHGAAEDMGWEIEKFNVYMRDTQARIGSSFDYKIMSSSDGPGILEIKNVDWVQYKNKWIDDGEGNIEAPEHIELQIQHQMEVSGYQWTALVALVGGNEKKVVLRNRDSDIGKNIRERVSAFWDQVQNNTAPSPDYKADADFIIKQLHGNADPNVVAVSDAKLDELIEQYVFLSRAIAEQEELKGATKAQILQMVGNAGKIISPLGTITCVMTRESRGTLITPDMVGTRIGGRKSFRNFRFVSAQGE